MGGIGKKRRASSVEDSDNLEAAPSNAKKAKSAAAPTGKDDEGNPYWELSNKRRVGVSQFKNMCFINIREYYEKDGKMLPGKKGISLSVEQYAALLKAAPGINAALDTLGYVVDDEPDEDAAIPAVPKQGKTKSKPAKANIDATSDEDSN